jgi:cytochrome c oxidase subunit II
VIGRLLPIAASDHAADLDRVLASVHVHMAIQAIAWGAFFLFCLVRFRRHANPTASHIGVRPVVAVVAIAAVIAGDALLLATVAFPAWLKRSTLPPQASEPLEIRVIAEQFAWNIHYPGPDSMFGATSTALISASNPVGIDRRDSRARDDIGILNVLTLPAGRPVIVHLSSRDVVHSFTLNEMRVKQDATPGLDVRTWFTPTQTGRWDIACSQLCGLGHYRMRGEYIVVTPDEWTRWLQSELLLLEKSFTPR